MDVGGGPSGATVSFVIPAWRQDGFLAEAVASASQQDHSAVEVVVVLDGPDAPRREDFDPHSTTRIVQLSARSGPSAARNAGARAADGEYLAVLDADDVASPWRVSTQLRDVLAEPGTGVVGHSVELVDAAGVTIGERALRDMGDAAVRHELLARNALVHSATLMERTAFERVGGYDEALARFIDYDLFLRLAIARVHMRTFSARVGAYRVHPEQLSSRRAPRSVLHTVVGRRRELAEAEGMTRVRSLALDGAWLAANGRLRSVLRPRRSGATS